MSYFFVQLLCVTMVLFLKKMLSLKDENLLTLLQDIMTRKSEGHMGNKSCLMG